MDCQRPLRAVCQQRCGHVEFWRCDSYGCDHCGELKRRRLARLVDNGGAMHLANGMLGYFITLTAPGERDHRRWRQGQQRKYGAERVPCDCHLHGLSRGAWNRQESACWNRLRTSLTRDRAVIFAGAVEVQDGKRLLAGRGRMMLHRHVMLFTDRELLFEEVQALALAAGYGCVLDIEPVRSPEKAARYIAKYVSKSSNARQSVPWEREVVDMLTGEILVRTEPTYRLWSSSRRWGVTMREMKAAMAAQASARARYLVELAELLGTDAGSLAPESAGHVHTTGPPG